MEHKKGSEFAVGATAFFLGMGGTFACWCLAALATALPIVGLVLSFALILLGVALPFVMCAGARKGWREGKQQQ